MEEIFMCDKTFLEIGLDRSLPHIGVIMEKYDTESYPVFDLPKGYSFAKYKRGYEKQWAQLQYEVEETDTLEEAELAFKREFLDGKSMDWINKANNRTETTNIEDSLFFDQMYERMTFIVDDRDKVVGTGCVWGGKMFGKELQRLHWIAVSPEHQGKGLAKALVSKLLDIYNELDYSGYIHLTSQTWSYKALNIYMKFGFKPYFGEKPQNWNAVNLTSGNFEPWDYNEKNIEAWNIIYEKINSYQVIHNHV
jgi:ribosomal protein S18 acetylase RimI-like enzyme